MRALLTAKPAAIAGLLLALPQVAMADSLCVCLRCLFGPDQAFVANSGSMLPAIAPGDCIIVRSTGAGSYQPRPGDMVAVVRPSNRQTHVKRVIAVGGQTVQMIGGRLYVNGAPVDTVRLPDYEVPSGVTDRACRNDGREDGRCLVHQWRETLPNDASYPVLDARDNPVSDDSAEQAVPDGHVFLLGDNRDNSLDSRIPAASGGFGMVPLTAIVGLVADVRP